MYILFLPETNAYIGASRSGKFKEVLASMLKDKKVLGFALTIGIYHGIYTGFLIQAPFIFMNRLGMSAGSYGKIFFALSFVMIGCTFFNRFLIKKHVKKIKIQIIGYVLSIIGCSSLFISSYFLSNNQNILYNISFIFGSMSIHFLGHAMIMPSILAEALKDYNKVNGSAGSIFGFMYYIASAMVSFMISMFHSDKIDNFSNIFALLLSLCLLVFFYNNRKFK